MEGDYIDRALIRLRRTYEKDEVLGALIKQIREKEVEIGQLKSEVQYLQHALITSENLTEVEKQALVELEKDKRVKKMRRLVNQLHKEIRDLKEKEKIWIEKCAKLQLLMMENGDSIDGKF
jgi:chromosome segregation ATPase